MIRLIIEADLSSEELQVLIDETRILFRDGFQKPLVLQQTDCYTPLGFDEGYEKGYADATTEAISEIHKNYRPNGV